MTVLFLALSLSASHLFLTTPLVIGKEHFQRTEGRPLSKMKTTVSETTTPKTPPSLLLTINRNKIMKERNTPEGEVSSPRSSHAKCKYNIDLTSLRSLIEFTQRWGFLCLKGIGHAILANFSTDQMIVELTKISQ